MDYGQVTAGIAIYLIVGFMIWLEVKTKNDISLKAEGRAKWREPRLFKIVPLWLPFYIINLLPWKWGVKEWLYK